MIEPRRYRGPERRDGSLTLADRLDRIERRQDTQAELIDGLGGKLDRILGGILLLGAGMPFVLFALTRLFP
jgi:tetrahydromethanopterin S-methyltransferase subunit G